MSEESRKMAKLAVEALDDKKAEEMCIRDRDEEALDDKGKRTSQPKVTPIHRTVTKKMPGTGMEVCVDVYKRQV